MAVKTKVFIVILSLLVLCGAGVFAYFTFFSNETKLPGAIEEDAYIYPYTGLKADSKEATEMRPLCVKIPNDSPARPQTGINSADIVYETMVEGGETRINAIFQSNIPEEAGPVRSARLSDIWIVPQYNGMLFFSGANSQVRGEISAHNLTDMRWDYAQSIFYRADNGRDSIHSLMVKLPEAYDVAAKNGYETTSSALKPLHFKGIKYVEEAEAASSDASNESSSKIDSVSDEATSGSALQVKIGGAANIEFKWDEESGKYLKWEHGEEHKDTIDDAQVNVDNVIIMWAEYVQQSKVDAAGSPTYDTILGGTGKASIFIGGKRYDCEWRADEDTPPRFYNSAGEELLLKPGKTWVVVPPEFATFTSK